MQYIKYFELAAALAALINWQNIRSNKFLSRFALLIFVITVSEFTGYFLSVRRIPNVLYYNTVAVPVQFILYGYAFYAGPGSIVYKKLIAGIIAGFIIIYAIAVFSIDPRKEFCTIGYYTGSVMTAVLAMLYISLLINKKELTDFMKLPVLYLMLCLIFYYLITIPFFALKNYYPDPNTVKQFLSATMSVLNYTLYLSFIFTFLCPKKTPLS